MKKRVLSLFLVFLMAAMLIPGTAITASAKDTFFFKDLTNQTADISGVSNIGSTGTWAWDADSLTLTLTDFVLSQGDSLGGFYLPDGANVVLIGTNSFTFTEQAFYKHKGISCKGSLTISGTGSLTMDTYNGIHIDRTVEPTAPVLKITGGTLDITSSQTGMVVNGDLKIEGGTVKIHNTSGYGIHVSDDAVFSGGTVDVTSDKDVAILVYDKSAVFSGADVTVSAPESRAINVDEDCTFSAGKVTINSYGSDYAVYTNSGTITCEGKMAVFNGTTAADKKSIAKISDGAVIIAPADDDLIIAAAVLSGTTEQAKYLPFNDVNVGDWFYDDVYYCYENGLMNGVDNYTFAPNQGITRGMIVTILWRNEGSVATAGKSFKDVADGMYYTEAVKWANAKGIVEGYGDGTFRPDDVVSLEELAAIMFRYAAYKNLDTTARGALSVYSDSETVAKWAKGPVSWAEAYNMIDGTAFGTLNPAGDATRAQAAAMLARLPQNEDDTGYVIYDLPVVEPKPVRPLG